MLSHDLARELLARRNNDVRIDILVENNELQIYTTTVELRDSPDVLNDYKIDPKDVVSYHSKSDFIVIRAGLVYTGTVDDADV